MTTTDMPPPALAPAADHAPPPSRAPRPPLPGRPPRPRRRPAAGSLRRDLALLALVIAGAVLLRLALVDRSLWFDELLTVLKAKASLPSLLDGLADDVHPPLYYASLHFWVEAFGETPLAVRSLSIAWSVAGVLAVYGWAREAFPHSRAALPAATLAAFAPFATWYGTEARMYAQVLALTAVGGWLAWRTLARGPRPATTAALAVTLVALAYTHYFASLFLGALGLVALVAAVARPGLRAAAAWIMASIAVAWASLLPWVAFVLERRSPTSPDPTHYPVPDFYSVVIAAAEMLVGFQSFTTLGLIAAMWPLLGLLAILLVPRISRVSWRTGGLLALTALPAAVLVAGSIAGPRSVFDPRFLAVCAIPLYLLVGRLAAGRSTVVRLAAGAAVIAVAVVGAMRQNVDPANPKLYDYEGAIAAVNAHAHPGDALLLLPNFEAAGNAGEPVFDFYEPDPGIVVADTRAVGQTSAARTHAGLRQIWSRLGRQRPQRLYVIDAFATHVRGRTAAHTAHAFFAARGERVGRLPFAHASVVVYEPDWEARA